MSLDQIKYIISQTCHMSCAHCLSSSGRASPDELEPAEWTKVAQAFIDARSVKVTGGEPLMPPVLPKTMAAITPHLEAGVSVQINTNGWWPWDGPAGGVKFQVSIDGVREVHDAIRGRGSFDRAITFIERVRANGHKVEVMSSIFPQSVPKLEELVRFLSYEIGVKGIYRVLAVTGRWAKQAEARTPWWDGVALRAVVTANGGTFGEFYGACCGGYGSTGQLKSVAIDPQGYVVACPFLMERRIGMYYTEFDAITAASKIRENVVLRTYGNVDLVAV